MEKKKISSKISELSKGNPDFPVRFGEMCINYLKAFPENALVALENRDLRKFTYAIHQMKAITGLFELEKFNSYLINSPELFEASREEKKVFLVRVRKETDRVAGLISQSIHTT